jgi:hypothetical protein
MSASNGVATSKITHRRGVKPTRSRTGSYLPKARSKITNGKVLLRGVDNRSIYVRRFRDVIALLTESAGGIDACSQGEISLIRRAACLTVELERLELIFAEDGGASDHLLASYQRCANSLRRLLETVSGGLKRRSRDVTPTVDEYLRSKRQQALEAEVADD